MARSSKSPPLGLGRAAASLPEVPFPDEPFSRRVEVVAYRQAWAGDGAQLAARLRELLPGAVSVDHVGSTAVPGLPAKDCLDVMVQVGDLDEPGVASVLEARRRPCRVPEDDGSARRDRISGLPRLQVRRGRPQDDKG